MATVLGPSQVLPNNEGELFVCDVSASIGHGIWSSTDVYLLCRVRHRPHQLLVSLSHQSPALLDEEYPIIIDITNADSRELDVVVDVLLMPTDIDHASTYERWVNRNILLFTLTSQSHRM